MKSKGILGFASGLLVATSVVAAVYYLGDTKASGASNEKKNENHVEETLSLEDMKQRLYDEGFVIHTNEEWSDLEAKAEKAEQLAEKGDKEETDSDNEKIVYRTYITVSKGMTSIDVANMLEKAKIIKSASSFSKKVEDKKVSSYLQPGSYEVDSNMTEDEIISKLFKKRK